MCQFRIGVLFVAMLVSMVFVPAVSAETEKNSNEVLIENSITYTDAELHDLHLKYNISENDIKFANNELPYYLEGTFLDINLRVIAS